MTNDFKNLPVLISGADGFIGSHLTKELVSLGAKVNVFIEPDESAWRIKEFLPKIRVYRADITDFNSVNKAVKEARPLKIYHLAAKVDVDRSPELIDEMIETNLKGTLNILKALRNSQCDFDCFINTGTCEEYGNGEVPFQESQRENPISAYSSSKLAATNFCQMLYKTQKLPIVTLRPFLTYGPYQINDMLISSLVRKCLLNESFEMTKGEQSRDFNYVSDIVAGYLKASVTEAAIGEIINLGSGREYRITEVAHLIVKLTETKIRPTIGKLPYRSAETMHFYCSNEKARCLLNWQPKVSLEEGLKKTIHWYKDYLGAEKKI